MQEKNIRIMDGLEKFRHDIEVMLRNDFSIQNCKDFLRARGEEGELGKFVEDVKKSIGDS